MKYPDFEHKIIQMKNADLQFRQTLIDKGILSEGYHPGMETLHLKNAEQLDEIINAIGYPTIEKVGREANEAAWLIIQHSISNPDFMRKCAKLLKKAAKDGQASFVDLAYLEDRIATLEGKKQKYGTQFDWDENGELSALPFDDLKKVNQRRKEFGLNTLEEQISLLRQRAKDENQTAPIDIEKRKQEIERWKKKVGWIKLP